MTSQKQSDSKTPNLSSSVNDGLSGQKSFTQTEKSEKDEKFQNQPGTIGQKLHVRLEKDELKEFLVLLHDLGFEPDTVVRAKNNLEKHNVVAIYFTLKD